MGEYSYHRGHKMEERSGVFYYVDTGETVATAKDRPCGKCGEANTIEGHDACLGVISGAMNACCGHGDDRSAYIQFNDGTIIKGDAIRKHLKGSE